jgi:methylphosphotriester-DNA--protein-cysteine methyltransferase
MKSLYQKIEMRLDGKFPLSKLEGYTPRVREVLRIIEESEHMKNLNESAKDGGVDPAYFCRAFHQVTTSHKIEITCSEYMDWLRVKKAMEIFCTTPKLYEYEVAKKVGTCPRSLRRVFEKFTGIKVKKYRDKVSRGKIKL